MEVGNDKLEEAGGSAATHELSKHQEAHARVEMAVTAQEGK
jgi:hypothetical protein